jgi:hypothetical protein
MQYIVNTPDILFVEYEITHNNVRYCFLSGLAHYYKIHNVQSSDNFNDWIYNLLILL